jgi:hypothetical protein
MENLDFSFILYIDVKNECQDDAKMKNIKYDIGLKKWVIKYNYNKFMKDETLKPPNGYKAYNIFISNLVNNKTEYTDNIFQKLLQRYESC